MVPTLVALLLASVVFVPISRRLGLGSVLGYLVAGSLIGPLGLQLVTGRRVLVRDTCSLREPHGVIQVAMGWEANTFTSSAFARSDMVPWTCRRPRPT